MNEFRVGITPDFITDAKGLLEPALAEVLAGLHWEYMADTGPDANSEVIDQYDAVIALGLGFPVQSFTGLRRLALIARWGVGYDRIDVAACTRSNVILAIVPEAVRRPVAEGILTFIFALAKNLRILDGLCRAGRWREGLPQSSDIVGKTLGSVGAGNIARELFRLARGLGFGRLLAFDPLVTSPPDGVDLVDLETLLRQSDFVTINCPLTSETRSLISTREFGWMKSRAFLINTARGAIVDHDALVQALRTKQIAGAGLDVFETEPVRVGNPLLEMENVIVTPHSIAWTQELFRDNGLYACRNVLEVAHGRAPVHVVNREVLDQPGCKTRLAQWRDA